ncbi:hypothetical protein F1B92_02890 [Campylobacter sp. FMV-PI01]|uniref:DUF6844 domain-containing protein n=1 Tax=Campylobacter portucalensis TaxID=2608384 RepID=A0A6L5WG77_9BACT|nr:hypothetical protein [Campylobacter portucalensis]MSN96150.1 hypothetical protein [Campylobacter portucalensis]
MFKNLKLLSICAIFAMSLCANEVTTSSVAEIPANEVEAQNAMSDASAQDITPKSIEDFFDEFANEYGISYGESINGKTFFSAKATAVVGNSDADFAKALSIAYNEAFLNLQIDFIRDTYGKQAAQTLRKTFSDNSTNAKEFEKLPPEGVFSQLLTKISELAGAKLDEMLADLGVDAQKGISDERKKILMAENLVKNIQITAMGQISGLVPIQTAVTKDGSTYDIGVIAVMSEKTVQIARDIKFNRKSNIQGKGKKIQEFLPAKNEGFLDEFGIRLVYDENGEPVILSYGRWGYVKNSSDEYVNKRQKDIAQKQAVAQADAAISEFVALSLSLKENSQSAKEVEHALTQLITSGNTQESEKVAKNIIDIASSEIKTNSNMKLKGIKTLKKWAIADKNGIENVGVVRFYSYSNVKNTDEILNTQSGKNSKNEASKKAVKKSHDISNKSNMVNDLNDF